jgi:hypothetical protein
MHYLKLLPKSFEKKLKKHVAYMKENQHIHAISIAQMNN